MSSWLKTLRDRFERLSQRERAMVGAFGVCLMLIVVLLVGVFITDGLSTLDEENGAMRQALKDIETHRDSYLRAKAKLNQVEARIGQTSFQLQGFLEQAAKETGVTIPESNERAVAPAGKRYVERAVDLRLRSVKLESLAAFLHRIETAPNLVLVTALNVKTRDDHHLDLDVEMTVSTYEHVEKKEHADSHAGDKT